MVCAVSRSSSGNGSPGTGDAAAGVPGTADAAPGMAGVCGRVIDAVAPGAAAGEAGVEGVDAGVESGSCYRAHPRRATGSKQMLRPIAGAMTRSSAIRRSNCEGNIDWAPSLSA